MIDVDFIAVLVVFSTLIWFSILMLPWRPWWIRETLEPSPGRNGAESALDQVSVLIPARDEADVIATCLRGLQQQGRVGGIVVVDDQSVDGTPAAALSLELPGLRLVKGSPTPPGWSGKVWALQQGLAWVDRPFVLLLDADIRLAPGVLAEMLRRVKHEKLDLLSVMAELPMRSPWEKLLIPAFIYFFKLLYPFRLSNSALPYVAAAAGGCMLVRRDALARIDAFDSVRDALIDDCALAARIKRSGGRIWIGLSRSVVCARAHRGLKSIWRMVTRTAFSQLRYSAAWLGICSLVMALAFLVPPIAVLTGSARLVGVLALSAMTVTYWPVVRYYGLALPWTLTLPLAGVLYLGMTWSSAIRYWRGVRSVWKGRIYHSGDIRR